MAGGISVVIVYFGVTDQAVVARLAARQVVRIRGVAGRGFMVLVLG
jgi:hypothetical protein